MARKSAPKRQYAIWSTDDGLLFFDTRKEIKGFLADTDNTDTQILVYERVDAVAK